MSAFEMSRKRRSAFVPMWARNSFMICWYFRNERTSVSLRLPSSHSVSHSRAVQKCRGSPVARSAHLGDDLSALGLCQPPGAGRFRDLRPLHGNLFRLFCVGCFGRTSHTPPVFVSIAGEPIWTFWRNVKVPVYAPRGLVVSCA